MGAVEMRVNRLTHNVFEVFDLPDHLAPKADPALIADDERHLEEVSESLEQTIVSLSEELDTKLRAPIRMGQEAVERDLEVRRLSARLSTLRRFGVDLCLGHTLGAGQAAPVYVGRVGLVDGAGRQLVIDWRSAAAE